MSYDMTHFDMTQLMAEIRGAVVEFNPEKEGKKKSQKLPFFIISIF
jgi:hypothetical protein